MDSREVTCRLTWQHRIQKMLLVGVVQKDTTIFGILQAVLN